VINALSETCCLLHELHRLVQRAILIHCDNVSAVYLMTNLVWYQRTKHIEIDLHFVRDKLVSSSIQVLHVLTISQYADFSLKVSPLQCL
jgi:hypothetical protein